MAVKSGAALIADNLLKVQKGFLNSVNSTMKKVEKVLDNEVKENISITDHSLADLARLGHPYARRGPSSSLSHPLWQVHKQTGRLLSSKFSGVKEASITSGKLDASAFVGLNETKAPHALHVIFGTSKMIPRPVLEISKNNVMEDAKEKITKGLKNLKFNFK